MIFEKVGDDSFKVTYQNTTVHIEVNGTLHSTTYCTVFIEPSFIPYDLFLNQLKESTAVGLWYVRSVTPIVATSTHTCLRIEINRTDGEPAGAPGQGLHEDEEGLRLLFEQLLDNVDVWLSPR